MKKTILCIFCAFFLASLDLKSQINIPLKEVQATKYSLEVKKTIQILFLVSEKSDPIALTVDLINKIESLRQENEITYLDIDKGCKIKILPKSTINQINFKPLEDYIFVEKFEN